MCRRMRLCLCLCTYVCVSVSVSLSVYMLMLLVNFDKTLSCKKNSHQLGRFYKFRIARYKCQN